MCFTFARSVSSLFFFFSSRRRHTRCLSDWSSDVCSSDLYLRILRALRFSARFDFRIQPRTLEAAKANVQGLAQLSAERVRDEWFKGIATAKRVSKLLALWIDIGAARIWLPEIPGSGKRETGNV